MISHVGTLVKMMYVIFKELVLRDVNRGIGVLRMSLTRYKILCILLVGKSVPVVMIN